MLTLPGDVGGLDLPKGTPVPRFVHRPAAARCPRADVGRGRGRGDQRRRPGDAARRPGRPATPAPRCSQLADAAAARRWCSRSRPRRGSRRTTSSRSVSPGLLGNPATAEAFDGCDVLFLVGTDFPYRDFLPAGKTVVQLDVRGSHIGRRTPVDHAARRRRPARPAGAAAAAGRARTDATTSTTRGRRTPAWRERQQELDRPGVRRASRRACCAARSTTPTRGSAPSCWPRRWTGTPPPTPCSPRDTGMATVWLSRFVRMTGARRPARLLQPRLDGQRDAAGARGRRRSTGSARWSPSAATAGCRCCSAT